ncbi:MAG: DUF6438 domain-containing protein [Bacteroidota bacterium]
MFKYLFFVFLASGLLISCKNSQSGGGSAAVPSDFSLEIQHTGCRGNCPNYNMKVDANGNATYEGRHAVQMMGQYTKQLEIKTVKALVATLNEYKFYDFAEVYGGGVADIPAVVTRATMNGKTHRVEDIREAPQPLKEMEAKLENLIGMEGWTKK